jgi:hypothetical protein
MTIFQVLPAKPILTSQDLLSTGIFPNLAHLRACIREEGLPAWRISKRTLAFERNAVCTWLESRRIASKKS